MNYLLLLMITTGLLSCTEKANESVFHELKSHSQVQKDMVIFGLDERRHQNLLSQIENLKQDHGQDISVSGHARVLRLRGAESALAALTTEPSEHIITFDNESAELIPSGDVDRVTIDSLLIARKEFGLESFAANHPTYDGRDVIVGIIDEGVSPRHGGFRKTSTGLNKYIDHEVSGDFGRYTLNSLDDATELEQQLWESAQSLFSDYGFVGSGTVVEDPRKDGGGFDLNRNFDVEDEMGFVLIQSKIDQKKLVCLDMKMDETLDREECSGLLKESGEYLVWGPKDSRAVIVSYDDKKNTLNFDLGAGNFTGHGDAVATIISSYNPDNGMIGIAPGSRMVDFDINGLHLDFGETPVNIGSFLTALEWMGEKGANIVNISYSFFFHNTESQMQMQKALKSLVERYEYLITFSAGNNGPGIASYNRGMIYPEHSLVVGAHFGKEVAETLYGVTGIPDQGIPAYYTSVGPAPEGGLSPHVLAPLGDFSYDSFGAGGRAFSGSSSSAPSMAGFAAVMLSAIKQMELPYDLEAFTSSIKLSAKPLKGHPYVVQGFGLPQIEKALDIYKEITSGTIFSKVDVSSEGQGVIEVLNDIEPFEVDVAVRPSVTKNISLSRANELFQKFDIQYSHPWMAGPTRTVTSLNGTGFTFLVDPAKLPEGKNEFFGEIRLIDKESKLVYDVFPVTLIKPVHFGRRQFKDEVSLLPHEVKRFHLWADSGTKGFKIQYDFEKERIDTQIKTFDPSGVGSLIHMQKRADTFMLETKEPGWYQVIFLRRTGTTFPDTASIKIDPIKVSVLSGESFLDKDGIEVAIHSEFQSDEWIVTYEQTSFLVWKKAFRDRGYGDKNFRINIDRTVAAGEFEFRFLLKRTSLHQFSNNNCYLVLYKNNEFYEFFNDFNLRIFIDLNPGDYFDVSCQLFENGLRSRRPREISYYAELNRVNTQEFTDSIEKLQEGFNFWDKGFINDWDRAQIYLASPENPNSRINIGEVYR